VNALRNRDPETIPPALYDPRSRRKQVETAEDYVGADVGTVVFGRTGGNPIFHAAACCAGVLRHRVTSDTSCVTRHTLLNPAGRKTAENQQSLLGLSRALQGACTKELISQAGSGAQGHVPRL
jgi:hypothetical protein